MRTTLIIIGLITGLFLLIFLVNEFSIFGTKFWGVRKENARREVFEQTQSYVEGKRQELIKLHHEWNKADADSKLAIEATIRASFATFDESKIEQPELYSFLKTIKYK
jgi:hypothetical protein